MFVKKKKKKTNKMIVAIRLDAARDKGEDSAYAFPNQIDEVLDLLLDATKLHDGVGANVAGNLLFSFLISQFYSESVESHFVCC